MVGRLSLLVLLVAAGALAFVAPAGARKAPKRCHPHASQVVARHGHAVVYLRNTGPDDGEYGPPSALFGCRAANRAPHRLVSFSDGDSPTFAPLGPSGAKARFNGRYVAFSLSYFDIVCSKYQQDNCAASITASFDLTNGRRVATARDPAPGTTSANQGYRAADLALTTAGSFAWIPAGAAPRSSTASAAAFAPPAAANARAMRSAPVRFAVAARTAARRRCGDRRLWWSLTPASAISTRRATSNWSR